MSHPFGPSKAPPSGWVIDPGGVLVEDGTVSGYLARGREVKGVCHVRDCRRRCEVDLGRFLEKGLGCLWVHELKPLYKCNRLGGCALEFTEHHGVELTLSALCGRDYVWVRIACGGCRKATVASPEAVAARLTTEKTGGPDTPIAKLADLVRGPCPKCNVRRWRADVLWHNGGHQPHWLKAAKGEA